MRGGPLACYCSRRGRKTLWLYMVVAPKTGRKTRKSQEAFLPLLCLSWFRFCHPQPGGGAYGLGGEPATKFESLCRPALEGWREEQRGLQEEQESMKNGRGLQDSYPLWGLVLKGLNKILSSPLCLGG